MSHDSQLRKTIKQIVDHDIPTITRHGSKFLPAQCSCQETTFPSSGVRLHPVPIVCLQKAGPTGMQGQLCICYKYLYANTRTYMRAYQSKWIHIQWTIRSRYHILNTKICSVFIFESTSFIIDIGNVHISTYLRSCKSILCSILYPSAKKHKLEKTYPVNTIFCLHQRGYIDKKDRWFSWPCPGYDHCSSSLRLQAPPLCWSVNQWIQSQRQICMYSCKERSPWSLVCQHGQPHFCWIYEKKLMNWS